MQQYFFDEQIRRYLIQFARMFSGFQVEFGRNEAGAANTGDTLYRVPVRYGDSSRQVQNILQENSASNMPSTPLMTFYITGLDFDRPRMQNPTYVDNKSIRQREYDSATGTYETTQGNAFLSELSAILGWLAIALLTCFCAFFSVLQPLTSSNHANIAQSNIANNTFL